MHLVQLRISRQEMLSSKDKLPKGRSYPLKPSELERAISHHDLRLPVEFTRWDKFDDVLQASFYPDGSWPGHDGDFIWVYCKAVPSEIRTAISSKMLTEAIPQLMAWAKNIESLDAKSTIRREKQSYRFSFDGNMR
ncbi:hypothetical protein [Sphingobium sp. Leaf26]|uniref:hypothetical protein n=1 Tax=Sphingobium sp. Leaf26 TaxID=1735693 RepID=UPI0012E0DAB3|nr:hypothetical protein [Sphingobium sp. Leaf26]